MTTIPAPAIDDHDSQLRLAAFSAMQLIIERTGGVVTREELQAGFRSPLGSGRIPFASRGAGIWTPAIMPSVPGAALSLLTSLSDPYADSVSDDGWIEYGYQRGPIDNHFNTALRNAHRFNRPLMYFKALEKGLFTVVQPVFVIADNPALRTVLLAADAAGVGSRSLLLGSGSVDLRRYATTTARIRLHQDKFRFAVLSAYRRKCSVCTLGDRDRLVRLLDAAHIIADSDIRGQPMVSNGLSLCKIHHSAYDLNIVGISPDYRVHINHDVLHQKDGPMLRYGIQGMEGRDLAVPNRLPDRPNRDFLAERFEEFIRAA